MTDERQAVQPLMPEELETLREHVPCCEPPNTGGCICNGGCPIGTLWPCPTARMLATVDDAITGRDARDSAGSREGGVMYSESDWRGLIGCLIGIGVVIGVVVMLIAQWACAHVRVTW